MGACRECRRLFYVRYFRTESSKSCGTTFYILFRRILQCMACWGREAMELKDKEYTMEEVVDLIKSIDGDFMIHIRLEDADEPDEGSI